MSLIPCGILLDPNIINEFVWETRNSRKVIENNEKKKTLEP